MSGVHGAMGSPEADAEHIREAQTTVKMVLILDGAAPSAAPLISGNIVLAFILMLFRTVVPRSPLLGFTLLGIEFLRRKISKNRLALN
jgi:hypothetical protein